MDVRAQPMLPQQEEIGLHDVVDVLRAAKWRIAAFVLISTLAAMTLALVLPRTYRATITMSAVSSAPGAGQLGSLSSLLSQFGSLSSLAGLSVSSDSKRAESVTVLESEALTERYIAENHLLPVLYAREWDARAGRWRVTDPKKVPTLWKANQYFAKGLRTVDVDARSGIVRMTISWKDPAQAAEWANGLVRLANDYLRKKAIDESDRNIAYLNEQAAKTDVVGVKEAIYALLQNEINKEMLARGTEEYAFKVLDPARPPEKAAFPPRTLMVLIGFFGSLALCVLVAYLRVAWSRG